MALNISSLRAGEDVIHSVQVVSSGETLRLDQCGPWYELWCDQRCSAIRNELLGGVMRSFPFDSTVSFSSIDPDLVMKFYIPNTHRDREFIQKVREYLQGGALPGQAYEHKPMLFRVISLQEDHLFSRIKTVLKTGELCLFHFTGGKKRSDQMVIKSQIRKSGILSEMRQRENPLLSALKLGTTSGEDRMRNDHHYVHCFLGYPVGCEHYLGRLQTDEFKERPPLEMAFKAKPGTLFLPFDQAQIPEKSLFTLFDKVWKVDFDLTESKVNYFKGSAPLFSYSFNEGFDCVDGLYAILSRVVCQLEGREQERLLQNAESLKNLFNGLFAFHTQVSVPIELEYTEYPSLNLELEKRVNQNELRVPDLKACFKQWKLLKPEKPTAEVASTIEKIISFFTRPHYGDGEGLYPNAFSYLGGISAQLALHFEPEICHLFTPELLRGIVHMHYNSDRRLVIKNRVTLSSLIEHSLSDLNRAQLRMPPNRAFNTFQATAETHYLKQLTMLYGPGSPLMRSLFAEIPMKPFSQKEHIRRTVEEGIARLSSPVELSEKSFSNLHGYVRGDFLAEFERGMNRFIEETALVHYLGSVIQMNIGEFISALLQGCTLLAPRFKHDLLDFKHFCAGIANDRLYFFLDGQADFRELIKRCLLAIREREKISVNGQLIVDTVHQLI